MYFIAIKKSGRRVGMLGERDTKGNKIACFKSSLHFCSIWGAVLETERYFNSTVTDESTKVA